MARSRSRRTRIVLAVIACAGCLVVFWPHAVHAVTTGSGLLGGAISGVKQVSDWGIAISIFYFGLYALMNVASWALGIVGGILDYAFMMNTFINPGQILVVQKGWVILRDLANGLFVLLVVWIAITIIFNLEGQYGGRRFLVRIILVALFINFSLAMVSLVFGFANKLAEPFAAAMDVFQLCTQTAPAQGQTLTNCPPPKQTLSTLIINNSKIHEVTKIFIDQGALEAFQGATKAFQTEASVLSTGGEDIDTMGPVRSVAQYLGAPKPAHAITVPGLKGAGAWGAACVGVSLVGSATPAGPAGGALAGALCSLIAQIAVPAAAVALAHATGIDTIAIKAILNLTIADAFLILTLLGLLTGAVILLLRIVAMVFLGVLAPVAFLGIAFPKFGDRIWSPWLDNLFRWAFAAPIFYFLLYLSLLMLQTNAAGINASGGVSGPIPFAANFLKILNLVLFLVFFWAAVYMTRKTAGHFADAALNVGRRFVGFGAGVATGFAARGLGRAALRFAPGIERATQAIGRTPLGLALGRRTQAYLQAERQRVENLEKEYAGGSAQYLAAQLRSTRDSRRIAAIGRVAAKEGKMEALAGREADIVNATVGMGGTLADPLLAKLPHLVTAKNIRAPAGTTDAQAIEKVVDKMSQEDKTKLKGAAIGNTDVLDAMWRTSNENDIAQIGLKNTDLQRKMFDRLNAMTEAQLAAFRAALSPAQDRRLNQYFNGQLGNGTGLSWRPANWNATAGPGTGAIPLHTPAMHTGTVPSGSPYPRSLSANGGSGAYTWRVLTGALPAGLTLNPSGTFAGTITAPPGTYTFDAQVNDGISSAVVTVTIVVT